MFKKIKNFFIKKKKAEQEVKEKEFLDFIEEDKENITNILRPIIKNLNSDDAYKAVCEKILESKILKTYSYISENRKILVVRLTQNRFFNEKIADFIADYVLNIFKTSIDVKFMGKYEIEAFYGEIIIRKIS